MRWIQLGEDLFEIEIPFDDLPVGKDEIASILGYADGNIPPHFAEIIDYTLRQFTVSCTIRAGYRILDCERRPREYDGMEISGIFFSMHRIVTRAMKKSRKAVLFVCSLDPHVDLWTADSFNANDPVEQYISDAVASVAVEKATDLLHDTIGNELQMLGMKITNRYSPGYCQWPVSDQHLLFSLLPPGFCGVTLTESALMMPIKSVSGIIGAGPDVVYAEYICDICGVKECLHRASRLARASAIIKSPARGS